jgi:hypothetical protein
MKSEVVNPELDKGIPFKWFVRQVTNLPCWRPSWFSNLKKIPEKGKGGDECYDKRQACSFVKQKKVDTEYDGYKECRVIQEKKAAS